MAGLGYLPHSGLRIADDLAPWDAERRFAVPGASVADHRACQCGSVLTGRLRPQDCRAFGTACTPENPIGTCMVSAEGACEPAYAYAGSGTGSVPAIVD